MSRIAGSTEEVTKMVDLAPFYKEFSRYCEYYLDKRDRICKGVMYGEICIRRLASITPILWWHSKKYNAFDYIQEPISRY